MIQRFQFKRVLPSLIVVVIILGLGLASYRFMGQESFVRTALSGLTLGALYFMVAAGLTIIFGLMDVLNFAHGAMFMTGAYMGWQFYANPTFLFGILPLALAFVTGLATTSLWLPVVIKWQVPESWTKRINTTLIIVGLALVVVGFQKFDVLGLAETALVPVMHAGNPLAEASPQETLAVFWSRPVLLFLSGLLFAIAAARPGDKSQHVTNAKPTGAWIRVAGLVVVTAASVLLREPASIAVLKMNADIRFFLALIVGTGIGAGLGVLIEISLIRPLYARPFYIVLMTLGLGYVLRETVQLLWDPVAYAMERPPLFSQAGEAENIAAWFTGHNLTIDIVGVTFPSYRLFIIVLGGVMLLGLFLLMRYSRLGMIIRAGVQDRNMVEALGINVKAVFSVVFAIGVGLAALGGIGAAPFVPVQPNMGDVYQLQGFITVVIGGMGSYLGAGVGALLLGMARAFGDFLALKFSLSPAIAEASTVIVMIIVLLVRPAGLLGKKDE
ncbi:MAG: branched-chain amino acid ABC transporter permease [Anaerolineae bacterium]|nr:branched-chain amino acid ABC transporter permease [Anaerolineae bacterium]